MRRISWTRALVLSSQHDSWGRGRAPFCCSPRYEKRWKSCSPGCSSSSSKCTLRRSMRTGVPVFIRSARMPQRVMLSVKRVTAGSAIRPPATVRRPTCIRPLRKVPAVTTMLFARNSMPQIVRTPTATPRISSEFPEEIGSTSSSSTWSCQMSKPSIPSSVSRHFHTNFSRSHCARGLHTAGPLPRFSIRN